MGDAALRNLERAWQGGDPAARQQLAEGYLRRGQPRAAVQVFAEAPPTSALEAQVYGRAWSRVLAHFQPLERVAGLRAYGELVGWCGPRGRYGALWNRERGELRVLDRERVALLADGLPLRGVTGVAIEQDELYVSYDLGVRAWGRWRLEPDELPETVSHVPFAARWEPISALGQSLVAVAGNGSVLVGSSPEGDGALLVGAPGTLLGGRVPAGAALRADPPRVAWVREGRLSEFESSGAPRGFDLGASWRRVDPVAAASADRGWSGCSFLEGGELLSGNALVDLGAETVRFARERVDAQALQPRADRDGEALLALVAGRLRRIALSDPVPLVACPVAAPSAEPLDDAHDPPQGWWHPLADVAAVGGPRGCWIGIPEQRPAARLPLGTLPLGWTPEGDRLLVARGGADAVGLELWGAQ